MEEPKNGQSISEEEECSHCLQDINFGKGPTSSSEESDYLCPW
jgi:hypothetical protein